MRLDLRLVVPAAACWIVGGVVVPIPHSAIWWAAAFGCVAVAAAFVATRHPRGILGKSVGVVALACIASATIAGAVSTTAATRSPSGLERLHTHALQLVARVDGLPVARDGPAARGQRVRVTASELRAGEHVVRGSIPVLVFFDERARLRIGETVSVHGSGRTTEAGDDVALLVFASKPPTIVADAPQWLGWSNAIRDRFSARAAALPGDGGDLLPGLAVGDERWVSPGLDAAMKSSSLSHLTAVSGANCAIVVGLAMALGAIAGLGRAWRVALAMVVLAGFVILVTPGPSVLRAAIMSVVVAVSFASGRPGRGLPALGLAVIVLLAVDPWMSRSYGFALSVLATAGLLVLAPVLHAALARWLPSALAFALAVPASAQLACQPVLVLIDPVIPGFGVLANLLAEPAAAVATIVGLLACVLMSVVPPLGMVCAQLAWLPSSWIAAVARACSALPGNTIAWADGLTGFVLAALAGAIVVRAVLPARGALGRRIRRGTIVAGLLAAVIVQGVSVGSTVGRSVAQPRDWQIAACDIGQGDAVVVRDGDAHALVDTGPDPKLLRACLDRLGIDRIDLLVLTHFDLDHVGGVAAVVGRVETALTGPATGPEDQRIVESLTRAGARTSTAFSGDHGTLAGLTWRVLWPDRRTGEMSSGNEGSVTLEFEGRGIRSLFLGDLDELAQNALLRRHDPGRVDVVKVAHHGSADQSEALYDAIAARLALISVGAGNDYGHPTPRLLQIVKHAGTRALRTDRQGLVMVGPGNDGITVWTEKQ